jgi:hypothetical protein
MNRTRQGDKANHQQLQLEQDMDRVRCVLAAHPEGTGPTGIARDLGWTYANKAQNILRLLCADGQVVRHGGKGGPTVTYTLAPGVRASGAQARTPRAEDDASAGWDEPPTPPRRRVLASPDAIEWIGKHPGALTDVVCDVLGVERGVLVHLRDKRIIISRLHGPSARLGWYIREKAA